MKHPSLQATGALLTLSMCLSAFGAEMFAGPNTEVDATGRVVVSVSLRPSVGEQVSGLQFDLEFARADSSLEGVEVGAAAAGAGKAVNFNEFAPGRVRVIVAGFNQNAIPAGVVARLAFRPKQADSAMRPIKISRAVLSDPYGSRVAVDVVGNTVAESHDHSAVSRTGTAATANPNVGSIARYASSVALGLTAVFALLLGLRLVGARRAG